MLYRWISAMPVNKLAPGCQDPWKTWIPFLTAWKLRYLVLPRLEVPMQVKIPFSNPSGINPERGYKRWLKYRGHLKVYHHTDHWAIMMPQPSSSTRNQGLYSHILRAKSTSNTFSYRPIYYAKKSDLVTGETYFVDLIRGLKWLQHQDNRGAYYYFCEDDQKCLWELPILDGLLIAKGQVMYGKQEEQWCSRRIIVVEKNRSNLHILRTNFRCETAVSREISLNILDTPTQWTRTSSHILNLRICRSTSSSTSLDINIKFDARADLVEWLSQLKLDFCHNLKEAQKTSQTHPTQGNWIIDFLLDCY